MANNVSVSECYSLLISLKKTHMKILYNGLELIFDDFLDYFFDCENQIYM